MNLRAEPHDFYLTRHGQSEYNAVGRIGGDSGLSKHGQKYAQVLGEWVEEHITRTTPDGTPVPARLWTSTMRRTYSVILLFFLPSFLVDDGLFVSRIHILLLACTL
jgi:bisphosphoglycerate-dependent phosphoglycerate mutase